MSGSVTVQGQLSSTGYRYTTRPSATIVEKLDADDLLQGGSALVVSANVAQGVVLAVPPTDASKDDLDEDDDGIPDASEGTAAITTLGSAPAVLVGASDRSITLGVAGTGDNAFGFINRGSVSAAGLYDQVDATAIAIGGGAGQTVTVAGGISNGGTVAATSILGDAVGVDIRAGTTTPRFVNTGSMAAVSSGAGANQVAVVRIAAGANMPTFVNNGPITAVGGYETAVTGVQDLSGTLTSFTNTRIIAVANQPDSEKPTTGTATAIDLSANTTGVTITQYGVVVPDDGDPKTEPPLDSDEDGVPDAFEPAISGDIKMGAGADFLDIQNGAVVGDLYFGAGQDRLSIAGGAVVTGVINDSDGRLDIDVTKGTLYAQQTSRATISSLDVGADGTLLFLIDPQSNQTPGFNVTGQANLANGADVQAGDRRAAGLLGVQGALGDVDVQATVAVVDNARNDRAAG
ncbi:MAG: autotransporter outer membrane beta-barrel domain-containing protein, partial [Brevundimonas sp.]